MARQLDRTLKSYLEDAGLLEPATLGADRRPKPAPEALEALADVLFGRLHRQRRRRGREALLWVMVTLLGVAFAVGVWMVLQSFGSPARMAVVGLPALLFLLGMTAQLRRIWSEKVTTDLLLDLLRVSPPAEVPRLVETVFWQRHGRAAGSSPAGPFDPFIWPRPQGEPPRYDTFTIRILSDSGAEPRVLASSPAGQASGRLHLDAGLRDRAAKGVEPGSESRDLRPLRPQMDVGALGRELFDAVFTDDVLTLYDQCLGQLRTEPGRGLRLRLEIDPEDDEVAWLATLPWEALRRSSPPPPAFLGNRRLRTIVRSLDAVKPCESLPVRLPLRILVLTSNPAGSKPLDLARERRLIEESWAQNPSVDVVFLERASLRATMDRLHQGDGPFHVLHFMGHGGFDARLGSVLYFEDDGGRPEPVPGPLLAEELADHAGLLRLVVLNACHSADARKAGLAAGVDPFAGVGTRLIRQGLTAVVAMQVAIPDSAAVAFSETLYRRLAAGDPIDAAVADGRRTLVRMEPDTFTWAIPVLYLRSGDGRLLAER